mmetsp:Transcript_11206/g.34297  ORF Transcript_11206/g.34297 Transcript_11206/m.34297 type:complete len:508 (+) Transcript_11206:111-1634(+)|eukprot:CAMPEP_0198732600 /NCGR_PEP_ID=MMETSP1475-20131203/37184_1 /TAXON_ID= ORGANISM="Unidentified sp., Strain CCMP1999" /NCGR_SAMPLE_ID=MMETSP1475 /ASSEMBLY_ACC=CAM_ASM_001111 /LENGTH=507 /DNA_ID=CAMNT_0044495743 /DNA_START=44 /DNA_END=1567 /DNA_ORIENTATION=-
MAAATAGPRQFDNIFLAGQSSGSGSLKIDQSVLSWRAREGSRQEKVDKANLVRLEWWNGARGRQLRCVLKGGLSVRFEGFRESDFSKIDELVKAVGLLSEGKGLIKAKQASKGWNWGDIEVKGGSLNFQSDDKHVLDVSLSEVAQVNLNSTDELALEFHVDDTAGPNDECLVEMRFRVGDEENAKEVYEKIRQRADTSAFAGESLAAFSEVHVIVPRGRYTVDLYSNYFKMHGKSYDFKILYSSVSRLFLLPKPDEINVAFVVSIDPPIRQGNTHYPHLVFQFQVDNEVSVDINLSKEELKKKYNGKISKTETGDAWKVFSKVMKAFCGKSLHTPKTFQSAQGQKSVRTSLGANDGYLFFLDSSLFFVNKPPTYIRFDDIQIVKFKRMDLERRFDLFLQTTTGQNLLFSNIERPEFDRISRFLQDKNVPMEIPKQKKDAEVAAALLLGDADDESEDEDFDPNAKGAGKLEGASDDEVDDDSDLDDEEIYPEDEESEGEKPPKKKARE